MQALESPSYDDATDLSFLSDDPFKIAFLLMCHATTACHVGTAHHAGSSTRNSGHAHAYTPLHH
jgi:hypothetical protein